MSQHRRKNMFHIGGMFFPLRVVPVKIESKLKEHSIEKPPKHQYIILLKSPNFDVFYSK